MSKIAEDEVYLLGAGASFDAGIPLASQMTEEMVRRFNDHRTSKFGSIANFVVGGLYFQMGVRDENPFQQGSAVDVESFFNAIDLLARRNELEAAPFIGSWHDRVEELDRQEPTTVDSKKLVRELFTITADELLDSFDVKISSGKRSRAGKKMFSAIEAGLERLVEGRSVKSRTRRDLTDAITTVVEEAVKGWEKKASKAKPKVSRKFEKEFKKAVDAAQPQSARGDVFERMKSEMLRELIEIVWLEDEADVQYLRPLVCTAADNNQAIVTLNYDNTIELAADSTGKKYYRGLEDTPLVETGFDFQNEGLQLIKLHGSVDWKSKTSRKGQRAFRTGEVEEVDPEVFRRRMGYEPAVIFGGENKLTAEGPFLNLLRAYEDALKRSDHLTVVGYSFRDPHVNAYIRRWIVGSGQRRIRIIDPGFDRLSSEFVGGLKELQRSEPARVEILRNGAGDAFPELFDQ